MPVAVTLLSGALTLASGWQAFALSDLALLSVAAVFLSCGYFLLVQCMRTGEVSSTAPLCYSTVLFATLRGFIV